MTTFVVAGGCFWCLDAVYRTLNGVSDVVSGYTGGTKENPTYEAVIPAEVILDVFFTLHDPRQLNRQGNDVGTQYRSAMFFDGEEQKELFQASIDRANEYWGGGLVTTLEPLGAFYDAEEYHQNFFARNPGQGYCLAVAVPKVNKVRASFASYIKD
jgi:peptide-methionine (S)-S-oxide reductase